MYSFPAKDSDPIVLFVFFLRLLDVSNNHVIVTVVCCVSYARHALLLLYTAKKYVVVCLCSDYLNFRCLSMKVGVGRQSG